MRKVLLFALTLGISSWGFAQNNYKARGLEKNYHKQLTDTEATFNPSIESSTIVSSNRIKPKTITNGNKAISTVKISTSSNVYGYLTESTTPLTVNSDIGVIHFTHRGAGVVGQASGDILSNQSRDGGATWTETFMVPNGAVLNNRYPSGVIYNPSGNTIADSAYIIAVGPSHDGNTAPNANVWQHAFLSSMQLDGTDIDNQFIPTYGAMYDIDVQITSDNKIHVIAYNYHGDGENTPFLLDTVRLLTGTWNTTSNTVDWAETLLQPSFILDNNGNESFSGFNTAWSNDGMIGYYFTNGRDSLVDLRGHQPIIWKTTDAGTTWNKEAIFDFSTLSEITDYLQPMKNTTIKRPFFSANSGVVDMNGNLHIISRIRSAFSNNDDSLDYPYYFANASMSNPIFDVHMTSTGWEATHLGDVTTLDIRNSDSDWGSGNDAIGWDLRLQASKTQDGSKIFATWAQTDTLNITGYDNVFPDIFVAGYDITTGKRTEPTNFTIGTDIDGDCYFHYMSDIILYDNGTYTIPMTKIDRGTLPKDQVTIQYITGISFTDADFIDNVGVSKSIKNTVNVSQNRPNPFNGTSQIDINLDKAANVSIDIINITGQKVYTNNYGTLNAGTHTITISSNNLASGIYFYTVQAGNNTVTKKMIVE